MKDKLFNRYLQEALLELEKEENFDPERCEKLLKKAISVVIDNSTEEKVEVTSKEMEKALAEALSKLTPGVKTVVEE